MEPSKTYHDEAQDMILRQMKRLDKAADYDDLSINELVRISGAMAVMNYELYRTPPMSPAMMGSMLSSGFANPPAVSSQSLISERSDHDGH